MKGTGTEDGKFRVNDFFLENHTEKEKIDFLKEEFGWYGRYTSNESLESQPSKGLAFTRTDKENPENNLNIHLSWQEVVEHLDSMVSGKTYITEKDIAERQRHALYVLKTIPVIIQMMFMLYKRQKKLLIAIILTITIFLFLPI